MRAARGCSSSRARSAEEPLARDGSAARARSRRDRTARRATHVAAALLYALAALWTLRPVRADPTHVVPARATIAGEPPPRVERTDERFVVGTTIATARALLADPLHFLADGGCHPLPHPFALGEHMIGESLLAALPYSLTHDPLIAYDATLALSWWIAAMAMYALALFWTRSGVAALLAGLLFGFHPARLGDPAHPYLYGNLWAPLVLLFAHRLLARGLWRDAAALALFGGLQLLESFYRVVGVSLLMLVYGSFLLARSRARLALLWPKLLFVALAVGGLGAALFRPYLEMRARFGVLQGRSPAMLLRSEFLPRQEAWLGWTLLALATIGLLDRVRRRRPRDGYDPRIVLVAAALLIAWCSVFGVAIGAHAVASPLLVLGGIVPGLDAVRALRYVWFDIVLVASLLAGYGVLALTERLRPSRAWIAGAVLVAAALLETLAPSLAARSFRTPALEPFAIGPNAEQRALYAHVDGGAVLDLPLRYNLRGALHDMSYYTFLRAYHGRPAAACYDSFTTPVQAQVAALAAQLPDPRAADTLYDMGFRWIVVHDELADENDLATWAPLFADTSRTELVARARHRAVLVKPDRDPERTYEQRLYRLRRPGGES